MQREDRYSEDVIKIFHNAKGSIKNKIDEWTDNENRKQENEPEPQKSKKEKNLELTHNYEAGENDSYLHR